MNNYWFTNTAASQSGRIELRYAFKPSVDKDLAGAARLGRELRSPGLGSMILQNDRCDDAARPLPATGRLFEIESGENIVVSVLAGRTDSVLTVRILETAGRTGYVTIRYPERLLASAPAHAVAMTPSEKVIAPLAVEPDGFITLSVKPYECRTIGLGQRI
jgi:hypothetical protein